MYINYLTILASAFYNIIVTLYCYDIVYMLLIDVAEVSCIKHVQFIQFCDQICSVLHVVHV